MQPCSLDAPLAGQPEGASLADVLGQEDPAVEHTLMMQTLQAHWHELPHREQQILLMRFYSEMTQSQIGERLGISQMARVPAAGPRDRLSARAHPRYRPGAPYPPPRPPGRREDGLRPLTGDEDDCDPRSAPCTDRER